MMKRHNAEFERAVRIEMLRAQATIERQAIASNAIRLIDSVDPRRMLGRFLPGNAQGVLSQGLGWLTRYPYVLTAVLTNRRFKTVRWLSIGLLAVGAWAMLSGRSSEDDPNSDPSGS
jgi:hypothetical protein